MPPADNDLLSIPDTASPGQLHTLRITFEISKNRTKILFEIITE